MSYLVKWQSISLFSRILAQIVGIIQGALILRLLSVSDWGLIQIILSFAAIVGTTQSVGLTSGSTREIAGANSNSKAYKVFVTSVFLRFFISLPFALFVYFYSDYFAQNYNNSSDVSFVLKILSISLLIDSTTGIFNSVLAGFQKFKELFIYQVFRALVSLVLFVLLVNNYGFNGYFYALLSFNILNGLILLFLALKNFTNPLPKITFLDFKKVTREIFGISIVIFAVKTIYSLWENIPNLYLSRYMNIPIEQIALFSLALVFAKKLMIFSDSFTDVTLPVMSKKFTEDLSEFKKNYKKNFGITFLIITFVASITSFWSKEIVLIYSGKEEFITASYLVPFVMLGVWSYSKINLIKSSVFIPANKLIALFTTYLTLLVSTYLYFFIISSFSTSYIIVFSISFGLGSFTAFILAYIFVYAQLNFYLLNNVHYVYFVVSILYIFIFYLNTDIIIKVICTLFYIGFSTYIFNKENLLEKIIKKVKRI